MKNRQHYRIRFSIDQDRFFITFNGKMVKTIDAIDALSNKKFMKYRSKMLIEKMFRDNIK